jgi:hypothetical protein
MWKPSDFTTAKTGSNWMIGISFDADATVSKNPDQQ